MLPFQIKSLQHPIVKHCVSLRNDPSYRRDSGSFLIVGKKELMECPPHIKILKVFSLDHSLPISCPAEHYIVSQEILKKITGLGEPQPYVAEIAIPKLKPEKIEHLLICESISDPGNLGTLLRSALGFGFDAVFLLENCVDPFNDKVVRAAKGALFHLPILFGNWEQLLELRETYHLHLYQADMHGTPVDKATISLPMGLILGNEAKGTSLQAKSKAEGLSIPMSGKTESLNVAIAGSILMFNTSRLCQKTTLI